jgi:transcriptional regulator with AAA-type ATPase domain
MSLTTIETKDFDLDVIPADIEISWGKNFGFDYHYPLVSRSPEIKEIFSVIKKVAKSNATILIQGETGTGKGLIAGLIQFLSHRADKPYVNVNCAALPENLLESELFGHEKGAFRGAYQTRIGKLEQANEGTILLDEIGDMPLSTQAKVLRVLQDQTFTRLGGNKAIHVDVRVIATTNKDLRQEMEMGSFRVDLYYRLSVVVLHIPPLRKRKEDILLIADFFRRKFSREIRKKTTGFSQEVVEALLNYSWPGNIRELRNLVERAVLVVEEGREITLNDMSMRGEDYFARANLEIRESPKRTKTIEKKEDESKDLKTFFQNAGFSIEEEVNGLQFSVSSNNPALKRYGSIPVKVLHHGKPTSESIREFYDDCKVDNRTQNALGFITVPPRLDTATIMQMFVYRSECEFTIVPFTIYAIERALDEDRCLKEVLDTIKLWKGEADLFGLSTPIRDPLWFFGREKIIEEIQEYIQSLQFVGIWGGRKMGKTSLLNQLIRKLDNHAHSYVDLQAVSPHSGTLFSRILDGFVKDIKVKFPEVKLPRLKKTFKKTSSGIISEFTNAIVKLYDCVKVTRNNAKFIVFIDEVDRLFPNPNGDASGFSNYRSFLAAVRGLSQNYGFFICVASGVEPTINLAVLPGTVSEENPTYNFFKELYLPYFERQEMNEMIERIASQLGIAFTETALKYVYEQTCGHPYLSRLLCSAIMKIRGKNPQITDDEARQGLDYLLSSSVFTEGVRHLRWLWDYLSDEEKEMIKKAKKNELKEFLSSCNNNACITETVNKLVRLGYLQPFAEGYRILPPIFANHLMAMGLI